MTIIYSACFWQVRGLGLQTPPPPPPHTHTHYFVSYFFPTKDLLRGDASVLLSMRFACLVRTFLKQNVLQKYIDVLAYKKELHKMERDGVTNYFQTFSP